MADGKCTGLLKYDEKKIRTCSNCFGKTHYACDDCDRALCAVTEVDKRKQPKQCSVGHYVIAGDDPQRSVAFNAKALRKARKDAARRAEANGEKKEDASERGRDLALLHQLESLHARMGRVKVADGSAQADKSIDEVRATVCKFLHEMEEQLDEVLLAKNKFC